MITKNLIAGVDEVGRGPLAGPVVAAAVILNPQYPIEGLKDSKKLSENKREALYTVINAKAIAWAVGRAEVGEIDEINILQASLLAMQRAVLALAVQPDAVWVDGRHLPDLPYKMQAFIKGDDLYPCISAASIMAKVTRDREMLALDKQYPEYGFAAHKGYPSKQHLIALQQHGITAMHRRSYAPVKRLLMEED